MFVKNLPKSAHICICNGTHTGAAYPIVPPNDAIGGIVKGKGERTGWRKGRGKYGTNLAFYSLKF